MNSIKAQDGDTEAARTIVRPPFLFLVSLLLGFILDHVLPLTFPITRTGLAHWISAAIAVCLGLIGVGLFAAAIRNFSSAATPVRGTKPTRALVTTGIYGWSRNPIYLGMFLFFVGIGVVVRSPWTLILTLPVAVIMRYVVVAREEAYLERRFADMYRDYKGRVRRWL